MKNLTLRQKLVYLAALLMVILAVWLVSRPIDSGIEETVLYDPPDVPLPPIEAIDWINGPPPNGSALENQVVVIDCWASWCELCARKAPELVKMQLAYRNQPVQFLGLTGEGGDKREAIQAFIDRFRIRWPNGYGADETLAALGVTVLPTIIVVGPDGRIAWTSNRAGNLKEAIDQCLALRTAKPSP